MILGRKLNKQNWINKLLKRKTDIEKESGDDNILIISDDYNRSVFDGLLLGAMSTSRNVLFISNSDFAPDVDTLKYKVLKIDLNDIDFNKYEYESLNEHMPVNQIFEKALSKYDFKENQLLRHNFIWVYNSRTVNKVKMMDTFYSEIIIKLYQLLQMKNNNKVTVVLNDWDFNKETKFTNYLINEMKDRGNNHSKVIASMVSSLAENDNWIDKLTFADQFNIIKIDGKIPKSHYSKYIKNTPEQVDEMDLLVQSLKDGESLLIEKTHLHKDGKLKVIKNMNYKEVL